MGSPSRRLHARYLCRLAVKIPVAGQRQPLEGTILNMGMGGAYIRVYGTLRATIVKLEITNGRAQLVLDARLVRTGGTDPKDSRYHYYGLEFMNDARSEQRIRLIVDQVRSNQVGGISLPMANYWNL